MGSCKILISGYYGFENFGDDAILYSILNEIKKTFPQSDITVISNNPDLIKTEYKTNSIYRFDFKEISKCLSSSDIFISGGGSLLQDITSLKSLCYYLTLIWLAKRFKNKIYIFAQGIGPIKTLAGKILLKKTLKKVDLITVRDKQSKEYLSKLKIKSILTSDPVWNINKNSEIIRQAAKQNKKVGIQLREWDSLTEHDLKILCEGLNSLLEEDNNITDLILLSLQDSKDLNILQSFKEIIKNNKPELNIKVINNVSIDNAFDIINGLDYFIAMRFHAVLAAMKLNVPVLPIVYDPKVKAISEEAGIPYIEIGFISENDLKRKIKNLVERQDKYIGKICHYAKEKQDEARQNFVLLEQMLMERDLS